METIRDIVQQKYGEAAARARQGQTATCGCGTGTACCPDPITSNLYDQGQADAVPIAAMLASLG